MPPFEALKQARSQGLDLVEVAPTANPPVCRIINYGKYLYQLSKRQHEAKKHQKSIELKEVKFRPRTSEHDFSVKKNHIIEFLQEGNKVKATVTFRGREMAHRNIGMQMIERLIQEVSEVGVVEARPRQEGPNLTAILATNKKTAGGKGSAPAPRAGAPSKVAPAPAKPAAPPAAAGGTAAVVPVKSADSSGTSGG